MSYQYDRRWSDIFIPTMRRLIGPHLICIAPLEVDQKQCGDLVVFQAETVTIGCRVRRAEYIKYRGDFTIRYSRANGAVTEYEKIVNGWGHWFFYCFAATNEGPDLAAWWLIDLDKFRAQLIRQQIKPTIKSNGDGITQFAHFPVKREILIATSE